MADGEKTPGDFVSLQRMLKDVQEKLDNANQELHECKRNLKTAEALQVEYEEEIRILQSEESEKTTKMEQKIQQIEENASHIRNTYNERIGNVEKELAGKEDEVEELKKELELAKLAGNGSVLGANDSVFEEVGNLKELNVKLLEENEELKEACVAMEKQMFVFKEQCTGLHEELSNLKENFDCKRDELTQANTLIQTLQDELMGLKVELDALKAKPLDDKSKGNSLFAEVDDRRVELQQNYNLMKNKYMEMKRERALHLSQISALHSQNSALVAQWESEVTGRNSDEHMILESYKAQIKTMEIVIESYKKEIAEKTQSFDKVTPVEMKFFDSMLNTKKREIESLRQKLSERSVNQTLLSHDLAQARREIWKWKSECASLKNEIGSLKTRIEEIQFSIVSPLQEKHVNNESGDHHTEAKPEYRPIIKMKTEGDGEPTNKENFITHRKSQSVKFTQETEEPKSTNRSAIRRGVKTLDAKPMHFSEMLRKE